MTVFYFVRIQAWTTHTFKHTHTNICVNVQVHTCMNSHTHAHTQRNDTLHYTQKHIFKHTFKQQCVCVCVYESKWGFFLLNTFFIIDFALPDVRALCVCVLTMCTAADKDCPGLLLVVGHRGDDPPSQTFMTTSWLAVSLFLFLFFFWPLSPFKLIHSLLIFYVSSETDAPIFYKHTNLDVERTSIMSTNNLFSCNSSFKNNLESLLF